MKLSVAVSSEWGIGFENGLLFRIKEDLDRFKELTTGKIVVMGRKTFESLPKSRRPLPNRTNIVLTRRENWHCDGVTVFHSIPALLETLPVLLETLPALLEISPTLLELPPPLEGLKARDEQDIFIIGGEEIYTQMLNHCKTAYVTKVHAAPPADAFFPNIDKMPDWRLESESTTHFHGELAYTFCKYSRAV